MEGKFPGLLIRRERLSKNWSQEGLCHGICAVSYLSKIEQGKAEASEEIASQLLKRLGIVWQEADEESARCIEELYDAVFALDGQRAWQLMENTRPQAEQLLCGRYMLDFLLLDAFVAGAAHEELREFSEAMDSRQYSLWLFLCGEYETLRRIWPSAFSFVQTGVKEYERGAYALAIEYLQRGYDLAAQEGYVHGMLLARAMVGNCYSNLGQFAQMRRHYEAALRLARALHNTQMQTDIDYNIASTSLELGRAQEAYDYFHALPEPGRMALHKLAVCCEALGRREEALVALDRAEKAECNYLPEDISQAMCDLVRMRLERADYLKNPEYGEKLLSTFSRLRKELPRGYAQFHARWMGEWYQANRQYRLLCELIRDFPQITE